jgi:metal-sulfur cluster biosynthetic enzyme
MSRNQHQDPETDLEADIYNELEQVLDPCSTFTDNPVSIVDLGLVEDVEVDGRKARIELLPTNQMCMYMMNMSDEIQDRLSDHPELNDIAVEQETEKIWTPARMADEERKRREQVFQKRAEKHDLTPHYADD